MEQAFFYICGFIILVNVSVLYVNNIDKMKKDHPDYKGDDFLE